MKTLVLRIPGSVGICAVGLAALVGLGGCFDNDPGMQEKLVRTQVELQEQKQKLADTEAALAKAQSALKTALAAPTPAPPPPVTTPAAASVPTKEQLNDGYITSAREMKAQLERELTGYSIVNCTLYQVDTVATMPYTSKVAVALRSDKGQQYKLEMPVGADASGKWKFPTTQEIVDNIAKNPPKTVASNTQQAAPTAGNPVDGRGQAPFQPRAQDRAPAPPPVTGMGNEGGVDTVTLSWSNSQTRPSGGGHSSGSAPVPPPNPSYSSSNSRPAESHAPAPRPVAPAPAQPSQPAPAMPADQSVLVTF